MKRPSIKQRFGAKKQQQTNRKRRLTFQFLESRELMAVTGAWDVQEARTATPRSLSADVVRPSQPATIADLGPVTGGGPVAGPGTIASNILVRDVVTTTGTIFVDPTPPPELGAKFENGVLTVTGSHEADNLFIFASDGKVHVREMVKDRILLSVPLADVKSIVVNANGGDDWVNVDEESIGIPATLRGDWGNDTLQGGAAGDSLHGGPGNDEILGRGGKDTIRGEHGDDLLVGGDGNDVIYGGFGNDYLVGGAGNDWLMGEEGDDQLFGEAGNDLMFGGPGQNTMDGGEGDDMLYGGDDVDAIYGGEGNDFLRGFAGDDQLRGEGGHDNIIGDDGNDLIDGGAGDDQLSGDNGNDVISGDDGNDTISGGNGNDWLDGKYGDDVLDGGAGNDFVAGGAGVDQVAGGSGSNQVAQAYPSGYVQYGVVTQGLFFVDEVMAGAEWVADTIEDVVQWTVDKAEAIGLRFLSWATSLDNRLLRLNQDLAGALSNWPWEADFWKGLGRVVIDAVEVAGLGEAWEVAFEILKPWQRGMTDREIALARGVYGNSINWNMVRLDEYSLGAKIKRTHVSGYIINSWGDIDDRTLIHELIHVWQYEEDGYVYAPEALDDQDGGKGYIYGGVSDLKDKIAAGQGFSAYNREQQGEIVADYFELRQAAQEYEARGEVAPLSLRQDLDVYIHFVKEVSTLTPAQLDTPDPVIPVLRVVAEVAPGIDQLLSPARTMRFGTGVQGAGVPLPRG